MNLIKHILHLFLKLINIKFIEYFCVVLLTLMINSFLSKDTPKAIDVYRGNTELKVEYKIVDNDTTSVDSTVVFK